MVNACLCQANASGNQEIESITVLADSRISVPLAELASAFSHQRNVSVAVVLGVSADQKKKIEDGDTGDVFITTDAFMIDQLKVKGLVDVYSIGPIASLKGEHFIAAVIASENMTPAREFLKFVKSNTGKKILENNDFTMP